MTAHADVTRAWRNAVARAEAERRRAERAAEIAERHERLLPADPSTAHELHLRLAAVHRQVQRQHAAAAAIHSSHANRLRVLVDHPERHHAMPRFMASVAEAANADSAAVTLFGPGLIETLTVVSDAKAQAAQDFEFTFEEGPARDTMIGRRSILATGTALCRRWPNYGPAIQPLGIYSLAAVPVQLTGIPLGALTVFGPRRRNDLESLQLVADTVAAMLLPQEASSSEDADDNHGSLLMEADHRAVIHQATGVVSVQCGCPIPDALALIRARAFADGRSIGSIASDIVEDRLTLT